MKEESVEQIREKLLHIKDEKADLVGVFNGIAVLSTKDYVIDLVCKDPIVDKATVEYLLGRENISYLYVRKNGDELFDCFFKKREGHQKKK